MIKIKKGSELSQKEFLFVARESVREFDNNKKPIEKELEELQDEMRSIFFLLKTRKK